MAAHILSPRASTANNTLPHQVTASSNPPPPRRGGGVPPPPPPPPPHVGGPGLGVGVRRVDAPVDDHDGKSVVRKSCQGEPQVLRAVQWSACELLGATLNSHARQSARSSP